jgi:hypothetical protein
MTTSTPMTVERRQKVKRFLIRFALLVLVIEVTLSIFLALLGIKYLDYA